MDKVKTLPLISVIVPVYNVEAYIEKCLQSICGQTYHNLEIILVDDGSTDASGTVCDKYAVRDSRIKVVHQPNGGLSVARNTGLEQATGEYLAFVDSDDWIESDMYEFLYRLLIENNADIAICSHFVEKPFPIKVKCSQERAIAFTRAQAMEMLVQDRIIRNYVWDKLYKRSLFENISFPQAQWYEDLAIMCKVFHQAHKIAMHSVPKYHYVIRENSITGSIYTIKKEYHHLCALIEQGKFIHQANYNIDTSPNIVRRAIHLIDHSTMLKKDAGSEEIINKTLNVIRQHDDISCLRLGWAYGVKRQLILKHLPLYGACYRKIRTIFKSKNRRFNDRSRD